MRHASICLATALLLAMSSARAQAPDPGGFAKGLDAVHALMQRGKWADALAALDKLLQAHERQPYVVACRDELVHDAREARFRADAKEPSLQDLLKGKVASFQATSGKVKLVYDAADDGAFDDWLPGSQQPGLVERFAGGPLLWHPATFLGDYAVTMVGKDYPRDGLSVIFDGAPDGEVIHFATFGIGSASGTIAWNSTIDRGDQWGTHPAESGPSTAVAGKPFQATVKVSGKTVQLLLGRKPLLKGKHDVVEFGRVAVRRGDCDTVTLEGRLDPGWYPGMVEAALGEQRARFDAAYDDRKALPAWLFTRPEGPRTAARHASRLPGTRSSEALRAVLEQWRAGQREAALVALRALGDRDAEPVTRRFLDARFSLQLGHPEPALAISRELLAASPDDSRLLLLYADVLGDLGRGDEALLQRRAALVADPGDPDVYEALVVALLRARRSDEALGVLRQGKLEHGLWDELAAVDLMLAMARRGPTFTRRFRAGSAHYEVVSDMGAQLCRTACDLLETAYVDVQAQFGWLKQSERSDERMVVYLFAAESSYQDYIARIRGAAAPHTAGLYSPVLKQLLVWNVPQAEQFARTLLHEGFHQYLDLVMPDPPTWFNEGSAEYWETASRENGRLEGGQVRRDHISTLLRSRRALPTLEQFVYGARGDFYEHAQLRYAQAWALVHFLREGGRQNEARYEALFRALRAAGSTRAALDAAFEGVDWAAFENEFWSYLAGLGR